MRNFFEATDEIDYGRLAAAYLDYVIPWAERDPGAQVCVVGGLGGREFQALGLKVLTDMAQAEAEALACVAHLGQGEQLRREAIRTSVAALRPGGVLLITGANPEHTGQLFGPTWAEGAAAELREAGLIRVAVLRRNTSPAPTASIEDVFSRISPDLCVIGQVKGPVSLLKAFYPAFAGPKGESALERLGRFQRDQAHQRLDQTHQKLDHVQAALVDQREEFESQLHALGERLTHATRRRGLRRLAWRLREARRRWRKTTTPPRPEAPKPALPIEQSAPYQPPLSPRERAIAARLTDRP